MAGAMKCFGKLNMDSHRHELDMELTGAQSNCSKGEICTSELSLHLGLSRLPKVTNRDTVFTENRTMCVWGILYLALRPTCTLS